MATDVKYSWSDGNKLVIKACWAALSVLGQD